MTLSTQDSNQAFVGDGVVTVFAVTYKVLEITDIEVYLDGVIQVSGFTVLLNVDQETTPGADITFDVAPGVDVGVNILRVVPLTQETDYQPFDAFPAESHETALDRLTMQTQQIDEEIGRALVGSVDTPIGTDLTLPPPDAGKGIIWNQTADGLENSEDQVNGITGAAQASADASASSAGQSATSAGQSATSAGQSATSAAEAAQSAEDAIVDFTDRLAGYEDTGLHSAAPSDLNDVSSNSKFYVFQSTNIPSDFVNASGGFLDTDFFTIDNQNGTQVLVGMHASNANKVWMRFINAGAWQPWKLVSDGGAFTQRLDGYEDTGLHVQYTGDLDDILINSNFSVHDANVTNGPSDFLDEGFLISDVNHVSTSNMTQVLKSSHTADRYKMWMRQKVGGIWIAWKLVVDGGAMSVKLPGYQDNGTHTLYQGDLDAIVVNSKYALDGATVTNEPAELGTDSAFITTSFYVDLPDFGIQMMEGRSADSAHKIWTRVKATTWDAWKLVVDGDAAPGGYEEGVWTPTVIGATTTVYTTQDGTYVRIGRQVTIQGHLTINTIGDGSSTDIGGLPFSKVTSPPAIVNFGFFSPSVTAISSLMGLFSSATTFKLYSVAAAGATGSVDNPILGDGTTVHFSCTYTADI